VSVLRAFLWEGERLTDNQGTKTSVSVSSATAPHVARRIAELAAAMPELDSLSPDQVDTVMKAVVFGELTAEARRRIIAARIN
jgi:hypothetical protein